MNGWHDSGVTEDNAASGPLEECPFLAASDVEIGPGIQTQPGHQIPKLEKAATAYAGDSSRSLLRLVATVVICVAWTCVSSVAILVNKHVMVDVGFKYPTTVACMGLVTTTILSYAALQLLALPGLHRAVVSSRYYLTQVMPTGFMMALTFVTGNGAYLHLTIAFVQMLKAFCPVITMLLLFLVRLERATPRLVASVTLISLGVAMASYGEMNMSLVGLATMLSSVVAEAVRLVMTQHLLQDQTMHPFEGLVYIGAACSFWLTLLALLTEWDHIMIKGAHLLIVQHPIKFAAAALAGFGVNTLAILVIKMASSLTLKVLGTVKDAALVTIGVVFLHEIVSHMQLTGYIISITGFVAYNVVKATTTMTTKMLDGPDTKFR